MTHRLALAMGGLVLCCGVGWAGSPSEDLQGFFAAATEILDDPALDGKPEARLTAIRALARRMFDFHEAARLALGSDWNARTAAERDQFVQLFSDLLVRSFIASVAGRTQLGDGVRASVVGESVDGPTASVRTTMPGRTGSDLAFDYRMIHDGARWIVRDVAIDGVGLTANYRAQFARVLQNSSYQELLRQMQEKTSPSLVAAVPEALRQAPLSLLAEPVRAAAERPEESAQPAPSTARDTPVEPAASITPSASNRAQTLTGVPTAASRPDIVPAPPPRALSSNPSPPSSGTPSGGPSSMSRPPAQVDIPGALARSDTPTRAVTASSQPQGAAPTAAARPDVQRPTRTSVTGSQIGTSTSSSRPHAETRRVTVAPEPNTEVSISSAPPRADAGVGASPTRPKVPAGASSPATRPAKEIGSPSVASSPLRPVASYWVQIGAFTNLASAMRLIASLQETGAAVSDNWAVIMEPASAGMALARVRVGPFPDRSAASARAHVLKARGYKAFIAEERESVR